MNNYFSSFFRTTDIYWLIPDNFITLVSLPDFIKIWNLFQKDATISFSKLKHLCNINVSFVWHSIMKTFKSKALRVYTHGTVNQKVEPFCGSDSIPTSPFKLFTRCFTIASPNPLPWFSVALADAVL